MGQKLDFILHPVVTSSVAGPRNSEALPKAKLAPKDQSRSLLGGLLPVWPTTAFWILVKPFHLKVCSANWWDALQRAMPAGVLLNRNDTTSVGPKTERAWFSPWQHLTTHNTSNISKVEQIELWSFASSTIFSWLLANWLSLLQASQQLFAGKIFHSQQEA